ncbi:MoxR family ATPase [Cohnella sp. LGH]|uniref:MoxR-like ATPase n=1 Tax=Cohnella phaseoli TaxID=456490 RepID=A0A3D9IRI4_9BACL|nr:MULTISPECIES: MoxR family ATPase [Cohnella]QTH46203.1 MoxR family ATPase [Cohnella sp. LGH]RED64315.1 MoxR-like ATPase [Cohnella phaseoli]
MDHHGAMQLLDKIKQNMESCIYGKKDEIAFMLTALLAGGHVLIEDVPGTGKTQMVKALALSIGGIFHRIQCNPDLLPTDITGVSIYHPKQEQFVFRPGPVMANLLLADEINRATTKTQSALLEAMEEKRVSVDGETYSLPHPFMLFATQNPIEFEGTYSLPEAQLDRFLMKIKLGYPDEASEKRLVMEPGASRAAESLQAVATVEDIARMQKLAEGIHLESTVADYLIAFIRGTRQHASVLLGASPRAAVALTSAAKAYAFLNHRAFVLPDDVKAMAPLVLGHRIHLRSEARMQGVTTAQVLQDVLRLLPVPVGMER